MQLFLVLESLPIGATQKKTTCFFFLGFNSESMGRFPVPPFINLEELQVMMGAYGLDLFTPEAVRESGKALSLSMLEIKDYLPVQRWVAIRKPGTQINDKSLIQGVL